MVVMSSAFATPHKRPPLLLAGVPVDRLTMDETVQWIARSLECSRDQRRSRPLVIMGPNAHIVTMAQRCAPLKKALRDADLCVADGISVVLGGRLLGNSVPERVTGGELMEQLCNYAAKTGFSVYFLGGLPGAAEEAARVLSERYPGLEVAGCSCPPLDFERDPELSELVLARIRSRAPDILCVALGVPKQEIWIHSHREELRVRLVIAVGAALDTQAKLRRRAPRWTHRTGLEWAYRLACEPRRLWRRYLFGNSQMVGLILRSWIRQRCMSPAESEICSPIQ